MTKNSTKATPVHQMRVHSKVTQRKKHSPTCRHNSSRTPTPNSRRVLDNEETETAKISAKGTLYQSIFSEPSTQNNDTTFECINQDNFDNNVFNTQEIKECECVYAYLIGMSRQT